MNVEIFGLTPIMYRDTIYRSQLLVKELLRTQADEPAFGATVRQTDFQILLALADATRHGYGIMKEVADRSGGAVRLGPGTLYGAIKRLVDTGLIEESTKRPTKGDDPRRSRYYRLTRGGRRVASEEAERLAAIVRVAKAKRLLKADHTVSGMETA